MRGRALGAALKTACNDNGPPVFWGHMYLKYREFYWLLRKLLIAPDLADSIFERTREGGQNKLRKVGGQGCPYALKGDVSIIGKLGEDLIDFLCGIPA